MNVEHTHKKERSIVLILQYPFYSSQTWIKTNLLIFLNFKNNKLTIGDLPLLDECRREELRRRSWHFLLPLFNKISPDYLKNNKTKCTMTATYHRGSILASHPVAQGSILGIHENLYDSSV